MCLFVAYLGEPMSLDLLTTRPQHSIIHQSTHSRERSEPLNGDGFGIAWYVPQLSMEPAVFRSISPAWNNTNLRHLARVTTSSCILAHVRAASPGLGVTQANCHPFQSGPLAFMHNGYIPEFARIKRALLARLSDPVFDGITGTTDSEHIFALTLERLRSAGPPEPGARLAAALASAIADVRVLLGEAGIDAPAQLNLAVSDGDHLVVSRCSTDPTAAPNSLYVHEGMRYICEGGVCRMVAPDAGRGAVLVASEPLSADDGWDRVPPNHLVIVRPSQPVEVRPLPN